MLTPALLRPMISPRFSVPDGNCVVKCQSWLKRLHQDIPDPAAVLGKLIEEFMEVNRAYRAEDQEAGRKSIRDILGRHGLAYHTGGLILGAANALPTKSLTEVLKDRDLAEVDKEFERSMAHVQSDPLPRLPPHVPFWNRCLRYISKSNGLEMPNDQSLKPLWKTASKHLGFDPSVVEDEDLKKSSPA